MAKRYFELLEHVGVEPPYVHDDKGHIIENPYRGELQPVQEWAFSLATEIPVQVTADGKVEALRTTSQIKLRQSDQANRVGRILPDTRIFEICDPVVAGAVAQKANRVREIDPPTSQALVKARKQTEAARQRAPKTSQEG